VQERGAPVEGVEGVATLPAEFTYPWVVKLSSAEIYLNVLNNSYDLMYL
jgi:hypothetical protein